MSVILAGAAHAQFGGAPLGRAHRVFNANVTAGPAAGGFRSGMGFAGGYGYGYYGQPVLFPVPYTVPVYVPVEVPTAPREVVVTRLSVELPAAGELWVNGVKQPGAGPVFVLESTAPAGVVTFAVIGRWSAGGVTYEYNRSRTLGVGESHQVVVVRGEVVK